MQLTSDQSRAAHSGGQAGPWQASRTGGRGCRHALSSSAFSSAADTRRWHTTERLRTPASQLRLQRDQFPTTQLWGGGGSQRVCGAGPTRGAGVASSPLATGVILETGTCRRQHHERRAWNISTLNHMGTQDGPQALT